jgi:hypothetical protein
MRFRVTLGALALAAFAGAARADNNPAVRHVLLISIDGMHAVDFINCATATTPSCPNLAALKQTGINYLDASTSKPSDSFPGLMALVTGGSPRTVGAFYDVAYDRVLAPPTITTGNGVAGGACVANTPNGTTTEYEEGIDINQSLLNGGRDSGIASIDSRKLPRDPYRNCAPVYPWNFVRTNTIFGVIHEAGGYTSWFDKHPAYSAVSGPGDGSNLDDFYAPEINSAPVPLPVKLPNGSSCSPLPDQFAVASTNAYTDSFQNIQCYDTLKVNAILNQIRGFKHDGSARAPVPNIFGMNFQAVSVGEKLIETEGSSKVYGGYADSVGTPSPPLLSEIQFVDASIGEMVTALKNSGQYSSTIIVVTAKHGQSPIDASRYQGIGKPSGSPISTSPATILSNANCLPFSESTNNPTGIGPTEDDVSQIWLSSNCSMVQAVALLEKGSPVSSNVAGIGQIFSGAALTQLFNAPGLPPLDSRTPDIIVTPNIGVTYSGSGKKQAEHGGFAQDDTNVIMLLSNPKLGAALITAPVTTMQVAPTILAVLGLNPNALQSVRLEGTQPLPGFVGVGHSTDDR